MMPHLHYLSYSCLPLTLDLLRRITQMPLITLDIEVGDHMYEDSCYTLSNSESISLTAWCNMQTLKITNYEMNIDTLVIILTATPQLLKLHLFYTDVHIHGVFLAARHCPLLMSLLVEDFHPDNHSSMSEMHQHYPEFFPRASMNEILMSSSTASLSSTSPTSALFLSHLIALTLNLSFRETNKKKKQHKRRRSAKLTTGKKHKKGRSSVQTGTVTAVRSSEQQMLDLSLLSSPSKLLYLTLLTPLLIPRPPAVTHECICVWRRFTALKDMRCAASNLYMYLNVQGATSAQKDIMSACLIDRQRESTSFELIRPDALIEKRSVAEMQADIDREVNRRCGFKDVKWDDVDKCYRDARALYWSTLSSVLNTANDSVM
jgi:hypothetical protein